MGETAEDAVKREVFEETDVHYEIDHLAIIHEIAFYYMMKSKGSQELMSNSVIVTQDVIKTTDWIPIEDLNSVKAYPVFMKSFLQSEHKEIFHIVTD